MKQAKKGNSSSLTGIFDKLLNESDGAIGLHSIFETFSSRSYGPLLLLPSLALVSPLGAIPGAPIALGIIIFLVSIQLAVGKKRPWIPKALIERNVERAKVESAIVRMKPFAQCIDPFFKARLPFFIESPFDQIIGVLTSLLAISVPIMGLIPFAVLLPGITIMLFAIALVARDGIIALFGIFLCLASFGALIYNNFS